MQYSTLEIRLVPGLSFIPMSTAREGETPGKSSGKTLENSFTMDTVSIVFSFPFTSTAYVRIAHHPCCTKRLAFIIDTIFGMTPVQVPLNLKLGLVGGEKTTFFLWQSILA